MIRKLLTRCSIKTFALAAFFFLLPWQTRYIFDLSLEEEVSQFMVLSVYVAELLLVLIATATFLRARMQIAKDYRIPALLAVAVCCYTFLSVAWANDHMLALLQAWHVACAMLVFLLLLDSRVQLRPIACAFALGLILPLGLGIWQVITDGSAAVSWLGLAARDAAALGDAVLLRDGGRELRAYGSFPHPNIFGGYLAVGLLSARLLWRRGMQNAAASHGLLALMGLLTVGLVLTASRSAILGLLLGIGLVGLVSRMRNTQVARALVIPIAAVVIGGALAATLWAPHLVVQLRGGGLLELRAVNERIAQYGEWATVIQHADTTWLLGNGVGQYVYVLAQLSVRDIWAYQPVHNVPLLIVAELGLVGALLVFSWSSTIDRINFARFPNRDALMAFGMGNVVLVVLFFDHYLWSSWPGLALIAYVMAMTVRLGESK